MPSPYDADWKAMRLRILERDGYVCQIRGSGCRGVANQVDHIVPLVEGGARLDPDNLRAACAGCNVSRNSIRQGQLAKFARQQLSAPSAPSVPSSNW